MNDQMVMTEPNGSALVALRDVSLTPMQVMQAAIEKGADPDKLGKLMELHFEWQRNEARLAYVRALQLFKANPPDISKTKKVSYPNKDGSTTSYRHAELDKINVIISQSLRAVGITSAWRTTDASGRTTVTCVLTHELGHSEEVSTLSGPADTSGGKNNIQAIGSTVSYLQRYTLLAGLGLAAVGTDDDGMTSDSGGSMTDQAIEDYLCTIRDSMNMGDLQKNWRIAYQAAQKAKDNSAARKFNETKDQRKRELA